MSLQEEAVSLLLIFHALLQWMEPVSTQNVKVDPTKKKLMLKLDYKSHSYNSIGAFFPCVEKHGKWGYAE